MGVSGLIMLGCVLLRGRFSRFWIGDLSFSVACLVLYCDEFLSYAKSCSQCR
jgi:hypothetical protein